MVERAAGTSRWRRGVWAVPIMILLAAAIANQTVPGFNWSGRDFIGVGLVLGAACLAWEVAVRGAASNFYRAGAALAIAGALVMVWVNLAVGMIGNEDNRANLVFFVLLALGAAGALIARLRPAGMARTMRLMAGGQALIAAAIVLTGPDRAIALICLLFCGLWALSGHLFAVAARPASHATA